MNYLKTFSIANLPQIEFGHGKASLIPTLSKQYGNQILLVTGAQSIEKTPFWLSLLNDLRQQSVNYEQVKINYEPSPQLIDEIVKEYKQYSCHAVVGLGGGSVLDAAKAIAGLLPHGNSVMDHLEGVGPELPYQGPALPYIAVPTTAGTGSEATKNAVLSVQSTTGFKKSFRDNQLVPNYALVDPGLLESCPKPQIAANGMDALTQLMESYLSINANPMTDALALDGLHAAKSGLFDWYNGKNDTKLARHKMAYASLMSGITLAQTGLGSVHGLAAPLGAYFPIPHGVVCGTLVAAATEVNIHAMQNREPDNSALKRYSHLGRLFSGEHDINDESALTKLITLLYDWTEQLELPRLARYRIQTADYPKIIANSRGSSMKTNPIILTDQELETVLKKRQ